MRHISDNQDKQRFELAENGHTAFVSYDVREGTLALTHTIVPEELEGQGVGTRLVQGVLDLARERQLKVAPACSFVSHFIDKHPEYAEMVAG